MTKKQVMPKLSLLLFLPCELGNSASGRCGVPLAQAVRAGHHGHVLLGLHGQGNAHGDRICVLAGGLARHISAAG